MLGTKTTSVALSKTAGQLALEAAPRKKNGVLKTVPLVTLKEMIEMKEAGVPIETIAGKYDITIASAYKWTSPSFSTNYSKPKKKAKVARVSRRNAPMSTSIWVSKQDDAYITALATLSGHNKQDTLGFIIDYYRANRSHISL